MTNKRAKSVNIYLHILGLITCIVPPAVCTLLYFPLWNDGSVRSVSGIVAIIFVLCILPCYKLLRKLLRSPSVTTVWLLIFVTFFCLSKIAYEMTVISFVGTLSNLIGSFIFRIAKSSGGNSNG